MSKCAKGRVFLMNRRTLAGKIIFSIAKCKQIYKYLTVESKTHKVSEIKIPNIMPIKKQKINFKRW